MKTAAVMRVSPAPSPSPERGTAPSARFNSEQRASILAAAIRVFADQGLKGASIRRVGKAAGVNSALIYYYFENKDTLFVEALRVVIAELINRLKQGQRPFHGARDRLGYMVNGVFDYYSAYPERMRLVSVAVSLHAGLFGKVINSIVKAQPWLPFQILQEGMAKWELKRFHPVVAWWNILAMSIFCLHVREVMEHVDRASLPLPLPELEQMRQAIVDLLDEGLAKKAE